jgi:hypothetical protein
MCGRSRIEIAPSITGCSWAGHAIRGLHLLLALPRNLVDLRVVARSLSSKAHGDFFLHADRGSKPGPRSLMCRLAGEVGVAGSGCRDSNPAETRTFPKEFGHGCDDGSDVRDAAVCLRLSDLSSVPWGATPATDAAPSSTVNIAGIASVGCVGAAAVPRRRETELLLLILSVSWALRIFLVWSGGPARWPDEGRSNRARFIVDAFARGDAASATRVLNQPDHPLVVVLGLLPAAVGPAALGGAGHVRRGHSLPVRQPNHCGF